MNAELVAGQKIKKVINLEGRQCLLIQGAFDDDYCASLLRQAKSHGFSKALDKYPSTYRNNDRLQMDNDDLLRSCSRCAGLIFLAKSRKGRRP